MFWKATSNYPLMIEKLMIASAGSFSFATITLARNADGLMRNGILLIHGI